MEPLPAWSLPDPGSPPLVPTAWPAGLDAAWAWGDGDGAGVRVAIVDGGVAAHPRVGAVQRSVAVVLDGPSGELVVRDVPAEDPSGHGTACAGIVRALAPACTLTSVRVLRPDGRGAGARLLAGLAWAIAEGHDVVNLSLSSSRRATAEELRRLADEAFHAGTTLVCAAHNMPVASWPWRSASVVSVASRPGGSGGLLVNPSPPVDLWAPGVDVEVAWTGGSVARVTGNSFAAAHVTGLVARARSAHPALAAADVKALLRLGAENAQGAA